LKFTKSCKSASKNEIYLQEIYQSSNQEMFAISLSSCSRYNANFKWDQLVFALHDSPPHILRSVRMTTHRNIVGEPRPRYLMNFRLAFVSPDVNSRGGLVPSHSASRSRLGDNISQRNFGILLILLILLILTAIYRHILIIYMLFERARIGQNQVVKNVAKAYL
jgi:hypothetical protein